MTDQVTAAFAGGESAFAALTERYRRELHVHCYRMLASFDEAEDAVQETFLRAWRSRDTFQGGDLVRAWLYKIATNVCLDAIRRAGRRLSSMETMREVPWITPYPDRLLDEMAPTEDEPDAVIVTRETIELAFLAALQVLPPRQRATLIARDVLGWPASETASALGHDGRLGEQRAPAGARDPAGAHAREADGLVGGRAERGRTGAAREFHRGPRARRCRPGRVDRVEGPADHDAAGTPAVRRDRASSGRCWRTRSQTAARGVCCRRWPTECRQPRATARRPATTTYRAFKLDVMRVVDGQIAEITTFGWSLFPQFGLPETVPG